MATSYRWFFATAALGTQVSIGEGVAVTESVTCEATNVRILNVEVADPQVGPAPWIVGGDTAIVVTEDVTARVRRPIVRVTTAYGADYLGTAATMATSAFAAVAGNHLAVLVRGNGVVASLTDTAGNTYVKAGTTEVAPNPELECWYAENILGHATNVVTATFTAAVPYRHVVAIQHSGIRKSGSLATFASGTAVAGGTTVSCTPSVAAGWADVGQVCVTGAHLYAAPANYSFAPPPFTTVNETGNSFTAAARIDTVRVFDGTVPVVGTSANTAFKGIVAAVFLAADSPGIVSDSVTVTDAVTATLQDGRYMATVTQIRGSASAPIDTTGATLIIALCGNAFGPPTFSDNKANTWTALTVHAPGSGNHRIFYRLNPTVGTGHTFTPAGSYASCVVYVFSGVWSYQTESGGGNSGSGQPVASGPVTPSANGALIVTGITANTFAVDAVAPAGFTLTQINNGPGVNLQNTAGWMVQAVAATIDPTWSWTGGTHNYTGVGTAVFLPTASGPLAVSVADSVTVADVATVQRLVAPRRVNIAEAATWTTSSGTTYASPAQVHTAGNALIVCVGASDGPTITGITDTAGNVYTKVDHCASTDNYREEVWYAKNITGHASNVVTVAWSAAVNYRAIAVLQYSGLSPTAPFDATAQGFSPSANPVTTGPLTTTASNEIHLILVRWGWMVGVTWPAGFARIATSSIYIDIGEALVASPMSGTYSVTHSNGASPKTAFAVAFKPSVTSSGSLAVAASEAITVADAFVSPVAPGQVSVSDTITVAEMVFLPLRPVRPYEDIAVTEWVLLANETLNVPLFDVVRVEDALQTYTGKLTVHVSDSVTVREGPMNHTGYGIGPNAGPPPGANLGDYWTIGIQ